MKKITWKSPSNIALIKYWGKHGNQLPNNPSISFTLSNAFTTMELQYEAKAADGKISLSFEFEGQTNMSFAQKIELFLGKILDYFPFLTTFHLNIKSKNSFPHSTGIASSASSMSALALCLCSMELDEFGGLEEETSFFQKASTIARLGSGSACRSVYPILGQWGHHPEISGSSDEFAIPYTQNIHPVFTTFQDAILIVSKKEKSVSSTAGHGLMNNNPFAAKRYLQANEHLSTLITCLNNGDLNQFGSIVEKEALTLHALMMMSEPSFILLKANTLSIIEKVQAFRTTTKTPLFFTLDAGPNVHLLYPEAFKEKVETFIELELLSHCEQGFWIKDKVGNGPIKL